GEAVVRLQGRSAGPFMIQVPEFHIRKGEFTDAKVAHHMTRLGLLSARKHTVRPQIDHTEPTAGVGGSVNTGLPFSADEHAFLADVGAFPGGGIAERYRRLAWSVRQGQKVKALLTEKNLVTEEIQTTVHGKIRVVRLTEQARNALNYFDTASSD